jgi:hypothetical protein
MRAKVFAEVSLVSRTREESVPLASQDLENRPSAPPATIFQPLFRRLSGFLSPNASTTKLTPVILTEAARP